MTNVNEELSQQEQKREKLRTYVNASGHVLSGVILCMLMMGLEGQKYHFPAVLSGLVGGWNTVLGIKEFAQASKMKRQK